VQPKSLPSAALALAAGAALVLCSSAALAGDPIPGINVGSGGNPGGQIAAVATTDKAGRFSMRIMEPGSYTVRFTCPAKGACPAFRATVSANGAPLMAKADMSFDYVVRPGVPVMLTGSVATLADHAAAAPGRR